METLAFLASCTSTSTIIRGLCYLPQLLTNTISLAFTESAPHQTMSHMTGYSWLLLRDRGLIADFTVVRSFFYFTVHNQTLKGFSIHLFCRDSEFGSSRHIQIQSDSQAVIPWPSAHMKAVARVLAPATLWWFAQDAVSVRSIRMPF